MNALPCFASQADAARQRAEEAAEARQHAENAALEGMQGAPNQVEDFLSDTGADVSVLLALIFANGFPLRDKSEVDDRHWNRLDRQVEGLKRQFESWAKHTTYGLSTSPLRRWMDDDA